MEINLVGGQSERPDDTDMNTNLKWVLEGKC